MVSDLEQEKRCRDVQESEGKNRFLGNLWNMGKQNPWKKFWATFGQPRCEDDFGRRRTRVVLPQHSPEDGRRHYERSRTTFCGRHCFSPWAVFRAGCAGD